MQIKWIRFLLAVFTVTITGSANAALSDWFAGNCKQIYNTDGEKLRKKDISENPNMKNAKFYTGLCAGNNAPSGKSYCVKMFSGSQLQSMTQAVQIAKDYAKTANKDELTCYSSYFGCKDNDDHIICSTSDNSAHYEFVFDDITEKSDAKYKNGIASAYCKMVFGENSGLDKKEEHNYKSGEQESISENNKVICTPSNDYASNAIYDSCVKMGEMMEGSFGYYVKPNNYSCDINFRTVQCSGLINELPDVNNLRFKTQQINLDQAVTAWLYGYVQRQTKKDIENFKCDLSAHTCQTGEYTNPKDDVLTCYADGKRIDFLFDDLSESKTSYQQGAQSAMQCMSETDGSFDGRRCRGLDEKQCKELDTQITGGTRWDDKLDACVFKAANYASNLQRTKEIMISVGTTTVVLAGVVATEVVSGGTATAIVVGALPTAIGLVTASSYEAMTTHLRNTTQEYMTQLEKCHDDVCARELLNTYFDKISYYDNKLPEDVIMSLDEHLADKVQLLAEADKVRFFTAIINSKDRDIYERYMTGDAPAEVYAQLALGVATLVFDFIPTARSVGKLVQNFTKLQKTAKAVSQEVKILSKAANIVDKGDTLNDVISFYSAM